MPRYCFIKGVSTRFSLADDKGDRFMEETKIINRRYNPAIFFSIPVFQV
jgi:hypothetical protein